PLCHNDDGRMTGLTLNGLTTEDARRRLLEVGANEPAPTQRVTGFAHLVRLFSNPLIVIMLAASIVSAAVKDWVSATIILVMVLLGAIINFIQTYHSQRAIEGLRKSVAPTATVLRDGAWTELPRSDIVPDDVIRLVAGDLVPADARLVESEHL